MRLVYTRVAVVVAIWPLALSPAWAAQHEGHQIPGTATSATSASVSQCAQNAQSVARMVDVLSERIEEARQTNDAATMRAAASDLQVALAQMKTQLADCTALQQGGSAAMGNMPGMDHEKMDADKGAQSDNVVFTVRTDPAPPRKGENNLEITLKDSAGKPIDDAEVSLAFYMPAMPAMNMSEMRSTAQLKSAGNGTYKGNVTIGMAGDWDVTITATRQGQALATKKIKLAAK